MGDKGDKEDKEAGEQRSREATTNYQLPIPYTLNPTPHTLSSLVTDN
ncbi:hypothetical protein QH73_0013490 [Scytonema millei VB511283]|uniref:Uncharacterized protein n=1 Tax=Scytonema millei VB511283 TaxID=1245923 RepID=A0A9X5E5L6_9CYAN|nr:hypothetical protein [Scytonema millei VB511283]